MPAPGKFRVLPTASPVHTGGSDSFISFPISAPLGLARQLKTSFIVTGFPEQRLSYLREQIRTVQAQQCAVLEPKTFELLGLVRFSEIAANPGAATRILADLMETPPAYAVREADPVQKVVDLIVAHDPANVVIERNGREFVGLITPESFARWLLASQATTEYGLSQLPEGTRWNPCSQLRDVTHAKLEG